MTDPAIVRTERLSKDYGTLRALRELDLELRRGEIFGFLGPNGAGKTTTIRLLLGLLHPTSGRASVLGFDCWSEAVDVRRRVGYLPGDVRFYDGLDGRRLLRLLARLRGGDVRALERRAEAMAERLQLDLGRRVRAYSKGNKQKLGIVQALMHEPELLVLDEPTSALDPLMQAELYALLEEARARGATTFFSSHILSEVEKICDRVAIIRGGTLLELRTVAELDELELRRVRVRFADAATALPALDAAGHRPVQNGDDVELTVRGAIDPLIKLLARFEVEQLAVEPMTLEEIFFEHYRGELAAEEEGRRS